MNRSAIRKQLTGSGPFLMRTSDGKEFNVAHGEFVCFSPSHIYIEDQEGGVDIVDPLHVVSIRSQVKGKPKAGA